MQELVLVRNENLVVSSRSFADGFDVQHKNLLELIKTHQEIIESNFGRVAFETDTLETAGGVQEIKVAYLTENQALFIGTLLRNSDKAVLFKALTISEFSRMKEEIQKQNPQLPQTYKQALLALIAIEEEKEQLALQVDNLSTALDSLTDWVSIIKVSSHNKVKEGVFNWRVLKTKSIELGYQIKRVPSPRVDYQNLYHVNCFKICYPQYNYDFNQKSINLLNK